MLSFCFRACLQFIYIRTVNLASLRKVCASHKTASLYVEVVLLTATTCLFTVRAHKLRTFGNISTMWEPLWFGWTHKSNQWRFINDLINRKCGGPLDSFLRPIAAHVLVASSYKILATSPFERVFILVNIVRGCSSFFHYTWWSWNMLTCSFSFASRVKWYFWHRHRWLLLTRTIIFACKFYSSDRLSIDLEYFWLAAGKRSLCIQFCLWRLLWFEMGSFGMLNAALSLYFLELGIQLLESFTNKIDSLLLLDLSRSLNLIHHFILLFLIIFLVM